MLPHSNTLRAIVAFVVVIIGAIDDTMAQITGPTNVCAGAVEDYLLEAAPGCTVPTMTLIGGTWVTELQPTGAMQVSWNNVATGRITADCSPNGETHIDVTIINNPVPTINGTGTTINCGTGQLLITANSTINTTSYNWSYPSGVSGPSTTTSPSTTVTFTAMGGGDVTVSSVNANCNDNESDPSSPFTITRVATPSPTLSKNSTDYELCNGESWTLTANSSFGTSFGYDWYITYGIGGGSGVLLNGESTSSGSPLHTTTNTVTVTAPSGYGLFFFNSRLNNQIGCTSASYSNLESRASTYSSSEFSISGPTFVCANSNASYLSGYIGSDILDYKWGWSSGFISPSGQGTPYLDVTTDSFFSSGVITLQLKNRCGYTGSPRTLFVSGGSCGFNVTASPNPTSTKLDLNVTQDDLPVTLEKPIPVRIVNSSNKVEWSGVLLERATTVDVSSFPVGIYYLKFKDGIERVTSTRIIIER